MMNDRVERRRRAELTFARVRWLPKPARTPVEPPATREEVAAFIERCRAAIGPLGREVYDRPMRFPEPPPSPPPSPSYEDSFAPESPEVLDEPPAPGADSSTLSPAS